MGNCQSKCDDKPFDLDTPPITPGYLKNIVNYIKKAV